jgi:hypothetical protein
MTNVQTVIASQANSICQYDNTRRKFLSGCANISLINNVLVVSTAFCFSYMNLTQGDDKRKINSNVSEFAY